MKLIDRHLCEGTEPRITIGHRTYSRKGHPPRVSRTWYAQWSFEGKHYYEATKATNKQAAIRHAHEICRRINSGQLKPRAFKASIHDLLVGYLNVKRDEDRAPSTLRKYEFGLAHGEFG